MFDDPRQELQNLEDQLLAAEHNQETAALNNDEFEELYGKILAEFGPRENQNGATESADEPVIRNFANGYGAHPLSTVRKDDEIPADEEPADQPRSGKGLICLVTLEALAIAGLAAYWLYHFLGAGTP